MQVNFLDVVIKIKNGRLSTERCSKLVDSYQSLHYNSCQEEHIKKNHHLQSNFKVKGNLLRED